LVKKKLKIEFNDDEGGNYSITLDGSMSKEKILKIMDIVELLGEEKENSEVRPISKDTSFGKLFHLIEKRFALGSFSSTDILEAFEDEYNKPIRLSTISTYLTRFESKKLLIRQRTQSGWIYKRTRIQKINQ
jgi:hypothetical protein